MKKLKKIYSVEMPKTEVAILMISFDDFNLCGKTFDQIAKYFMSQHHPGVNFSVDCCENGDKYEITVFAVGEVLEFRQISMD